MIRVAHRWHLSPLFRSLTLNPSLRHPLSTTASGGAAVKKVTRSNFEPVLEDLRTLVRESDFVAFDLEMSGVSSAPWRSVCPFDDLDVQYLKVKDSAERFAIMQFGVCPFRWDALKGSFVARPFFGPGISYLSMAQETEAQHAFSLAHEGSANFPNDLSDPVDVPLLRTADVLFTERMKNKLLEWRDGILKNCVIGRTQDSSIQHFHTIFFKMRPALLLDGFSSHQHNLIQLVVRTHFKDLMYIRSNDECLVQKKVVVYSASDSDKSLLMKEVWEDFRRGRKEKIKLAAGFRHIIDLLAAEKKLLVGHNCILDIMHIHDKFIGPLPSRIGEFSHSFHSYFPRVMDTQYLLKSCKAFQHLVEKRGSRSLSSVFARLCPDMCNVCFPPSHQHVKIEVPEDEIGPSTYGVKHEAGYDALMTGSVFVQACAYLGINFNLLSQTLELSKHGKLQEYKNLVCVNTKKETIINLEDGIETPCSETHTSDRRHMSTDIANILVLWGFLPKIKPGDIRHCLSKVYGTDSVTSVFYLDETAVFIQFSKQELVEKFLQLKDSLERKNNVISVLHPLATLLEGGNTRAANYSVYKDICKSSITKLLFADQAEAVGIRWMTQIDVKRCLGSQEETLDSNHHAPAIVINANETRRFPADSYAHSSYKPILESLYEFSR